MLGVKPATSSLEGAASPPAESEWGLIQGEGQSSRVESADVRGAHPSNVFLPTGFLCFQKECAPHGL